MPDFLRPFFVYYIPMFRQHSFLTLAHKVHIHFTGMREFRIDQDFLIEHWQMIYIMPVVFAEIYFLMKLNSIIDLD